MKSFYTFSCLFVLITDFVAQPVINRGDIFNVGDQGSIVDALSVPDIGPGGPNAIWDFSDVQIDSQLVVNVRFENTQNTFFAADYPTSNLAQIAGVASFEGYQFMVANNDRIDVVGDYVPGFIDGQAFYSDPLTILEFPLQYQSQWDDEATYEIMFSSTSITYLGESTTDVVVDGYGTVMLPQSTFDDVLRLRTVDYSRDSTSFGAESERIETYDTSYLWISPSYPFPLAVHYQSREVLTAYLTVGDTVLSDSETTFSESFTIDPQAGLSTVHDIEPGRFHLSISPNPIESNIKLDFIAEHPDQMEFILQDMNGRVFFKEFLSAQAGENSFDVKLPDIPSGMYFAILDSVSGGDIQKLIRIGNAR